MLLRSKRSKLQSMLVVMVLLVTGVSIGVAQDARVIAKTIFPSVVMLEMRDKANRPVTLGSGFFVRPGLVVTNYHVIEGATNGIARIVGNPSVYPIEGVVGFDKAKDLALLKLINVTGTPLKLADVSQIEVGQEVFALGNPKGLEGTISPGIVSGNSLRQGKNDEYLIQITAPISQGSSGGPIVNARGEVIGVAVSSLKDGQNLNFAIPSSYVAILLANAKQSVPLSNVSKDNDSSSRPEPSFRETAEWIISKLKGQQHLSIDSKGFNILHTTDSVGFSGCDMEVVINGRTFLPGSSSRPSLSVLTQRVPLTWIKDLGPATVPHSKDQYVGILLDREINSTLVFQTGDTRVLRLDHVKLPVSDESTAERATAAFRHLIKLCKQGNTKEPF